jgi:hypothetical protein
MRLSPVCRRSARARFRPLIAWSAALVLALTAVACTLPPNRFNDHPYDNLPRAHGENGW